MKKHYKFDPLWFMIVTSSVILFICSSLRHLLFQSTALDLGMFDQGTYLISQGIPPISSFTNYHILGDHAAWIWYPLALLYKIYPSVYWLFAVQAIALALGALPAYQLARQAKLNENQGLTIAAIYLLYPLVFNVNLFDFHPEVIAVPALLWSVFAMRNQKIGWFCLSIFLVLGCKAVLGLTVIGLGIWLLFFERRLYGAIAIISGVAWYAIANKIIIPLIGGDAASIDRYLFRYQYLGNSFTELINNLFFQPGLVLPKLCSWDNLAYLILLFIPIIWGISWQGIAPLIGALPCVMLNLLADYQPQKDLIHQYSVPALPFIILSVIASLSLGKGLLQNRRIIILWSIVAFLSLAKFTYFGGKYLKSLDTWQATKEAIVQIQPNKSVLTTDEIAPHLTHRKLIKLIATPAAQINLKVFDYVLLNLRHPGLSSNPEFDQDLVKLLNNSQDFKLQYQRDDVLLFQKSNL
ncbi:DUF2079 domain-containing protein [Nostoc sp. PCC 7107]|uniref:DUF2079 domain-containing protein n=1 Tax=Nostoc sp. PCC 7107 TaxID=317936 RepID=UPI00029F10A8|nr:DUF2079 domain-containing protein [Nostoc sp. PCC 7107]AFY40877.1 Protein of unknown function DUF2079, membrane [Nostoc sp. PCC 7107]